MTANTNKHPAVLFVCTGNICRSPMAAVLFRARLKKARPDDWQSWRIESAGTWATEGIPASRRSVEVMASKGLDISGHRARTVSREMLEGFDLILAMEPGHKEALGVEFPSFADRIFLLSEMEGMYSPVDDPFGGTLEMYQKTANLIDQILANGMERILSLAEGRISSTAQNGAD